jgi:hypothetical protein
VVAVVTAKKKLSNKPSARLMRRAVAYARLAAKAHHNGDSGGYIAYTDKYIQMSAQADRMKERGR